MSNKNRILEDVNENLKQTMQKINELERENESVGENEVLNSTSNFFKSSQLSGTKKSYGMNNVIDSQTKLTSFKPTQAFQLSGDSFHNSRSVGFSRTNQNQIQNMNGTGYNFNSNSFGNTEGFSQFKVYSGNLFKNLDNLYNDINKDFTDLENFIQNAIQH